MPRNRYHARLGVCEMDSLGVVLLVGGMVFFMSSLIFLIPSERKLSSSQETFEESLERLEHHLDEIRRTWRALEDRSAPTTLKACGHL
jgi:hypothetical protein